MRDFLQRYEVWIFLCLIPILNFIFVFAIDAGFLPDGLFRLGRFLLLGVFLVGLVFLSRGLSGVLDAFKTMSNWRIPPFYLLLGAFWALGIACAVLLGKALSGAGFGVFDFNWAPMALPGLHLVVWVASFVGEIVWVSYSLRQLSQKMSLMQAAIIVGIFWTIWWLPMVIIGRGVIPDLPLVPLLLNQVGVACACAFFYFKTRSGLCVLIMQILLNYVLVVVPIAPQTGGIPTYTAFAIMYFVVSVLALALWGPRPIFARDQGPHSVQA